MNKNEDSLKGAKLELVRDDKKAAHSPNTRLVASALACGFKYGTDKPFMESYEEVDGKTQVSVTWLMDASTKVPFTWVEDNDGKLVAREESISFGEFRSLHRPRVDRGQPRPPHLLPQGNAHAAPLDAQDDLQTPQAPRYPQGVIKG